jgi:TRAP-type C4-dicarboxylate transport system substrate-binding protein
MVVLLDDASPVGKIAGGVQAAFVISSLDKQIVLAPTILLYNRRCMRLNTGNAAAMTFKNPRTIFGIRRNKEENMRKQAVAAFIVAFALAASNTAPAARAQDKTFDLKLAHWVPPSHPLQKALEDWGTSVEKASGGSIKYKVFPAQQLGKAFDHYDMARDGIADLTYVNPGYQPGRFPIIGAGELPFLVGNAKGGSQALDAWYRKYADGEMKDVKFCLAFMHDPGTFHSRSKKIVLPGDLKGMKIRPAHATMATFVNLLGGTTVQSSAPEVRDIIEKGVADAVTFPWGSIPLFGIDKVTKYHMDVPLYATTFAFVFNKAVYGQMSASQKKVIDDHCTNEWAGKVAGPWAEFEQAGVQKLKSDPAHEVYALSEQQVAEWRKAAEPLANTWAENVKKVGVNPEAVMKELKESLAKHQAAY